VTNSYRSAGVAAFLLAGAVALAPGFSSANTTPDPLAHLAGRWVGNAVMTTSSGPSSFKCVVTYFPLKGGPGLQQNLRCDNGADFKLHAATDLTVDGNKVSGVWHDKINELEGTVAGNVTAQGFEVELGGQFFQAKMAVAGQGCDQSVKVLPKSSQMFQELAANLKKC